MHTLIVIPARIGSIRLPGKPLREINGEPIIRAVARNVLDFNLGTDVVLATDDDRLCAAVEGIDVRVVKTSHNHRSGTERVWEIAQRHEFAEYDCLLNVQGDQPFLPKDAATGALAMVERGFQIGTVGAHLEIAHEADPNRVKVWVKEDGCAAFFSRRMVEPTRFTGLRGVYFHLGVYAYSRRGLREWVSAPPTQAEFDEGLEQLRPFYQQTPIGVAVLESRVEPGIDTLSDLNKAQAVKERTQT